MLPVFSPAVIRRRREWLHRLLPSPPLVCPRYHTRSTPKRYQSPIYRTSLDGGLGTLLMQTALAGRQGRTGSIRPRRRAHPDIGSSNVSPADGERGGLGAVPRIDLVEDAAQPALDRAFRDEEFVRDFFVGQPPGNLGEDFGLPFGQFFAEQQSAVAVLRDMGEPVEHPPRDAGMDHRLPPPDRVDRAEAVFGRI